MLRKSRLIPCILIVLVMMFALLLGVAVANDGDAKEGEDHPLISRFPGSVIVYHEVIEFDEYILPLYDDEGELSESKEVAGQVTRIQYQAPEDLSTFKVYQNYKTSLKDAGFEVLYEGSNRELGWNWTRIYYMHDINPLPNTALEEGLIISEDDFRYLSAKLSREQEGAGDVYVSLCISLASRADGPGVQLDIIETKPMEIGLVEVRADILAQEISRTGAVPIHDIYFDIDEAEVKSESKPIIQEIAVLLKENPALNLYLVGHTDNTGAVDYNMELSKRRAESVMEMLVAEYNISQDRLEAYGVGPLVPIATNETEEGRAQNRRVELVKP